MIDAGHEERRILRGPLVVVRDVVSSISGKPPMPEPMHHADALGVGLGHVQAASPSAPAIAGRDAVMDEGIHAARFLGGDVIPRYRSP